MIMFNGNLSVFQLTPEERAAKKERTAARRLRRELRKKCKEAEGGSISDSDDENDGGSDGKMTDAASTLGMAVRDGMDVDPGDCPSVPIEGTVTKR
jgi:hypothetical protein